MLGASAGGILLLKNGEETLRRGREIERSVEMPTMVLIGAYGRTYTTAEKAMEDFKGDKDFTITNPGHRTYGNRSDFFAGGVRTVELRFNAKRDFVLLRADANGNWTRATT